MTDSENLRAWFTQPILESLAQLATTLARIESKLDAATAQELKQMAAIDDELAALSAQVTAETTVEASALALINGISARVAAAVAAALAAGATPAQLAEITSLGASIKASSDPLAAAVAANTPAA
jgi:hypothetical protein